MLNIPSISCTAFLTAGGKYTRAGYGFYCYSLLEFDRSRERPIIAILVPELFYHLLVLLIG